MKPHLPVSLFRALVTAVFAFPLLATAGTADIPNDYKQITVTDPMDATGSQSKMAFLIKPASLNTVTNPTMAWNPAWQIFGSPNVNVLFTSFDDSNRCSINMSFGSHLMTVGDATFVALHNVSLDSNNYSVSSDSTTTIFGGTILSGSMEHDDDGYLEGYGIPDGTVSFKNNRNVELTRNIMGLSVTNGSRPVEAYGYGGVIMSPVVSISGNMDVTIDANSLSVQAGTQNGCYAAAMGGAIYGSDISITNNDDVSLQRNRLEMTATGPEGLALGAAMYSNNAITITGNTSVTIRDNAVHYKTQGTELFYLESFVINSENQGLLTLAAGVNSGIAIYDPFFVDCNVSINAPFTNSAGQTEEATGNVILSSQYAAADLTAYRKAMLGAGNETPPDEELTLSTTFIAQGITTVYGGSLMLCDGVSYDGGGLVVNSGATLYMRSSALYGDPVENLGDGRTVFRTGAKLELKGTGSLVASMGTEFEGNNNITFNISSTNLTNPSITFADNLTFNSGTTIYITSDNQLTEGIYELVSMYADMELTGWSSANVTVSSNEDIGFNATYAHLRWETDENGIRHLFYHTTLPALLDAVWSNGDGDFVWSSTAINWEQQGQAYAFSNGATATFTDAGAGTVYLQGELRPSEVLVDNSADANYEWKEAATGGKLVGDMTLTKRGTGALKISLGNTYEGGTIVEGGTLISGHEKAFGTGDIVVQGGDLQMGDFAVTNNVLVNYGSFSGTAYAGDLTITGNGTIGENTTAKSVTLKAAFVSGGSFTNTNISAEETTIDTRLTGKTNMTVTGNTVLNGDHDSTGVFTIKSGTLNVNGSVTTDMNLQGGVVNAANKMALVKGQDIRFNGGNMLGSIETSAGSSVSTGVSSNLSDNLILNGGTFIPGGAGIVLKVGGELSILSATTVNVKAYEDGGSYVIADAGSITGDVSLLKPITDTRNENEIFISGSSLLLSVTENPATLYWLAGAEGQWQQLGSQEWSTDADDARFYNRDTVVFNNGGTAEIIGEVKPASILVEGEEEVTFSGEGSIAGKTALRKKGTGTLNMNAVNTYEGGTSIEGGTVNAGGEQSFGSGDISLQKGHLNMGEYAVKNNVTATGGRFSGTAYDGTLTVQGDLTIGDNTTAKEVKLEAGSINDGSLKDTNITATGPALIESALKGNTTLTVEDSETILNCKNSSTGNMNVNGGILRIAKDEALGNGDIYLNNGVLKADEGVTVALSGKQSLYFRGGSVSGNVRTGNATSIVLDQNGNIGGNLRLNGGTVYFNGQKKDAKPAARSMILASNGCTLAVSGTLTLTADTLIVLEKGQYADGDILLEAGNLTGDFGQLVLNYDDGNPHTEYALALHETDGKVQVMLDLDKVYEHTDGKWSLSNGELRDLLVQSNWGMFASSHAFTDSLQGQRSAVGTVGSKGVMVWASGLYSHLTVDDDGAKSGADSDTMGAAVGIETMVGSRSCVGLAIGLTSTDISADSISDEMEQDGTYFGIYGATVLSRLSETSGLTLSWSAAYGSVESSPSGAGSSIKWQQESFQLNGRLDWSQIISDYTTINMFAGLEYFMNTSDEVAGIDSGEIRNLRAELGVGITRRYSSSVLYAEARLLGDIMRDDPTPTINGWSNEGANPGTVGAGFRVGAAYDVNRFWSIGANGSAEIMGGTVNVGANIGASFKF